MPERDPQPFLARLGWEGARHRTMAGDASSRRYERLSKGGDTAVLMDAPPEAGERIAPFLRVAHHLRAQGFSAPAILGHDAAEGWCLMEDLGDAVFARTIADPATEGDLYAAATEALVHLQAAPPPAWTEPYGPARMTAFVRPAWTDYLGRTAPPSPAWNALEERLHDLLERHAAERTVLIHRDYHAENLIWLPERTGIARVGMLDFQDALAGHPAYDLASLVDDVRRDVSPRAEARVIRTYCDLTGSGEAALRTALAVQSVQRNLRILGVFAGLAASRGKPRYLSLLPRVWGNLLRRLDEPGLHLLRTDILSVLPAPPVRAAA
ncbi:aminoglycoside phosphotransferase [Palleronia sediminis]|uniref:Aminoglycoside phosphotransferase n=1 Tax=Palleronia sediminis TaxID=2547833 RepID=A0A4R6A6F1_9RHOB|nr:phosphotransferase [Palleronia sediminis]TDL78287.1 aminoglycoside phosphotransferase [Palleronia sediminis]